MPTISVIIGIYNCASTLQEALDSLYQQTFQDFEIILCDDGSSDETLRIAKVNADLHPNIKLIINSINQGLNITLNNCLKIAEGKYIARMDGDDISLPDRFEKEVAFLEYHPEYDIVSTPMIYFDAKGEFGRGRGGYEPTVKSLEKGAPFCHAPCLIRKEAYDRVGGYTESKHLIRYEDYNLWAKMFKEGFRGYVLDECLYAMRDDRNAFSRRRFRIRLNGIYAHFLAHKDLHLSFFSLIIYSINVLIAGLVPYPLYIVYHKKKLLKNREHVTLE